MFESWSAVQHSRREKRFDHDLLETGLDESLLPSVDNDSTLILMPHADFDWRAVSLTFLPHQLEDFRQLLDVLAGRQDLIGVADRGIFETFTRAASQFARIKEVRSAGTAVALLTEIALREIAAASTDWGTDDDGPPAV